MKPGKPLAFGVIKLEENNCRAVPLLGLPGNPTSCMVTFEQFAKPAILKMMGREEWERPVIEAILDADILNKDGSRVFASVRVSKTGSGYCASLSGRQKSGILSSLINANGLAVIPEDCCHIKAGEKVMVQLLDHGTALI